MADCESLGGCTDERIRRIYEYLDGVLPADDLEDIHGHLRECPACAREYDLECVIRSVVRRSCSETAPADLKVSILARIHAQRQGPPAA
ncbi:mycothiol system anti-sigma-R factor [Kocuria sp. LUK]|uniref:Anti-sigma factor n=1 Tax=Kocuria flava TaxID=446860 RepID=A0A2N4T2K3_9MICC|nr:MULTISPECIES: mycothiol system anti-sigma-R factor [Kocuria]MCD1145705.1 mycothiol system anti-sigma-R factor [Kocuria sp. LUK]PLC12457.1 anti-sigma factor [Kocuria flava]